MNRCVTRKPLNMADGDSTDREIEQGLLVQEPSITAASYCEAPRSEAQLRATAALERSLRRAMDTSQIYVKYQPVIDLRTGLLSSFEALARWQHPKLGSISPERFVPVAERSDLIVQLGERVVRDVVRQLRKWMDDGVPCVPVAVNVSLLQLERSGFSFFVHRLLQQYDIDSSWLSFEITESAWLQDSARHVGEIESLRSGGSRVYLDDFGTGFCNLAYLKGLPVDALKIDRGFVCSMAADGGHDHAIVSGIIHMAMLLKLHVIAEGVESETMAARLRTMGCHYAQGYHFSKPLPAARCKTLLLRPEASRLFAQSERAPVTARRL